jgi:2-methylcitrate dehydratase PrpD
MHGSRDDESSTLHVTAAERFARFALELRLEDVPDDVLRRARRHLLDSLGCALAAHGLGQGTEAASAVDTSELRPGASGIGVGGRLSAADAALVNGTLAHALDYDDTHPASICHISTVVAPAALAVAEAEGATGSELLAAYVAGVETTARVGAAAQGAFHDRGFHPTGVCGVFGAAVAAARLLRLTEAETVNALGIAGSTTVGIWECLENGTATKRLHAGLAARAGVLAARLAAAGATGPDTVFEGRFGLYSTHVGERQAEQIAAQCSDLDERWETAAMAIKPYPACHWIHAALEAAAEASSGTGLPADAIDDVHVRIPETGVPIVLEPAEAKATPRTPYEAKFSLPFSLAAMIVRGTVDLTTYREDALADPEILALARRVRYEAVPLARAPSPFSAEVEIRWRDGTAATASVDYPKGSPERPLDDEGVRAKFDANAGLSCTANESGQLAEAVLRIDELHDLSSLAVLSARFAAPSATERSPRGIRASG